LLLLLLLIVHPRFKAIPYEKQPMYTFYEKSTEEVAKDGC